MISFSYNIHIKYYTNPTLVVCVVNHKTIFFCIVLGKSIAGGYSTVYIHAKHTHSTSALRGHDYVPMGQLRNAIVISEMLKVSVTCI